MYQKFHCATPEELNFYQNLERANLEDWGNQLMHDIRTVSEQNIFFRENHRQWGYKAGVNSGNGQLEARIPAKLYYATLQKDPHFVEDDRAWDTFISTFPGLEVKPR